MMLQVSIKPYHLKFKRPATTSRGAYTYRKLWIVEVHDQNNPDLIGIGECAPLHQLSIDDRPDYEDQLKETADYVSKNGVLPIEKVIDFPSIRFGFESALQHLQAGGYAYWDNSFTRGELGIPFNGLVWMGSFEEMHRELEEKIREGFRCIKLKIGAIDFSHELQLIRFIRDHYTPSQLEIRVDANGAFSPSEALDKLEQLSRYDLHSIEQPIRSGQWKEMAELAKHSPIPIALDEELIPCQRYDDKLKMIETIMPQYIVLKPTLHGGMGGGDEWKTIAHDHQIGYWATSALESNIGLNAIAQWCACDTITMPQGLGTGELFVENFDVPIKRVGTKIYFTGK